MLNDDFYDTTDDDFYNSLAWDKVLARLPSNPFPWTSRTSRKVSSRIGQSCMN